MGLISKTCVRCGEPLDEEDYCYVCLNWQNKNVDQPLEKALERLREYRRRKRLQKV